MSVNRWTRVAALMAAVALGQVAVAQEEALKKLGGDLPRLIKAADADANGTLNIVEFRAFVPSLRKAAEAILNQLDPTIAEKKAAKDLKKYDKNGDGRLDDEEKKAMEEDLRLKEIKAFDWDRDGKLSEREKTAMQWAEEGKLDYLFAKTDANGDKQVSQDEVAAALALITGIKVKKVN